MGVNLKDLLIRKPITIEELSGKILVVDGYNMLYQFLSNIRSRDGALLTNSKGQVTSHIIGLFARTTTLMQRGIKLAFVFDGEVPKLKHKELQRRREIKEEAQKLYDDALAAEDVQGMQKYAARTSRLTGEMVAQAKQLLTALGIPHVQAPSEGEAQAAHIVKAGDAWAVSSQDYDSLLFGAPRLIQNLSIDGKRKIAGTLSYKSVEPLLLDLAENLKALSLTQQQLILLAIMVGTDYAPGGIKGIGPKKGLALVKENPDPETLFLNRALPDADWREVLAAFENVAVTDDYKLKWSAVDRKAVVALLVGEHNFGAERVEKTLDAISPKKNQAQLGDF